MHITVHGFDIPQGYTVRQAKGISNVFAECPYEGGYDYRFVNCIRVAFQSMPDMD